MNVDSIGILLLSDNPIFVIPNLSSAMRQSTMACAVNMELSMHAMRATLPRP